MFKKHLISLVLVWFLLVLGCFGFLYTFSSDAEMTYQRLMSHSDQVKKEHLQEGGRQTQQARHQVSKQILYKKGAHRMQTRLASDYSDLVYSKKEGELVEHFKGLACIMQEELIDASNKEEQNEVTSSLEIKKQMIRQFKAKEAVYSYKSGQLEAKEAEVAHYLLPGHLWPDSLEISHPLLEGRAHVLHLSLFKEHTLQVQEFQAIFHDWRNEW